MCAFHNMIVENFYSAAHILCLSAWKCVFLPHTHTYKLTSWEVRSCSVSQISRPLWNLKVHYRVQNSPSPVPILSQMNPVCTLSSYGFNICFNIILSFIPTSSNWFPPLKIPDQNPVRDSHLSNARYMSHPAHPVWFDDTNNVWWRVKIMKLLIMKFSLPVTSSLLGPNKQLVLIVFKCMWE
jgi:hypothetical protein